MKRLADQTLYEILEITPDAPPAEVASAYERVRALYGPGSLATYTLMSPEEAEELTRRIEEAREVLLDPGARARYDERIAPGATRTDASEPPIASGPESTAPADAPRTPPPMSAQAGAAEPPPAAPDPGAPAQDARTGELPAPVPASAGSASDPVVVPAPPPAAAANPPAVPVESVVPPRAPIPLKLEVEAVPAHTPVPGALTPLAPATGGPVPASAPAPTTPTPTPVPMIPPPLRQEPPVADATSWTGEVLRNIREARGISVQALSQRTKVTRHHLENIEADRFAVLPAPVYLRGILMSIARELRLDGQKVARSYLERVAANAAPTGGAGPAPR